MKMAWLLGWAVSPRWFGRKVSAVFPRAEHRYVPAGPDALVQLEAEGPCDWIVGYSLGAQLLLRERERIRPGQKVALLAPIFALAREDQLGGRVARSQISYLKRWLQRDFPAALADFYQRAQLDVPTEDFPGPAQRPELQWGLEQLSANRCSPEMPGGWRGWCGQGDPLLDAAHLARCVPGVQPVPDAGHDPAGLLPALAEEAR
jgi:hypothetical protein